MCHLGIRTGNSVRIKYRLQQSAMFIHEGNNGQSANQDNKEWKNHSIFLLVFGTYLFK